MEKRRNVLTDPQEDGGIRETVSGTERQEATPGEASSDEEGNTNQEANFHNVDQKREITNELDEKIREMIAKLEEMGPTISRYQYDEASNEVKRLSSEMKDKAVFTMIRHLQMGELKKSLNMQKDSRFPNQAAYRSNAKGSETYWELERRLKELEKQSNKVARRIKEHKRDQAQTMEKLQILEARAFLEEQKDFIKNLLTRVPSETDLQNLETIRLMMMERKRAESRIQQLDMRATALDKAMGAVAKSSWFIRAGQPSRSQNDKPDPRDLNSVMDSNRDITCNSREVDTGSSGLGSKMLPDFTQMSATKREAFLGKNFGGGSSDSPTSSLRGIFANTKKTKPETQRILTDIKGETKNGYEIQNVWSDDSGKSIENSGLTIVTMNSEEADNLAREPKGRTSAPKDPSDVETERHPDVMK